MDLFEDQRSADTVDLGQLFEELQGLDLRPVANAGRALTDASRFRECRVKPIVTVDFTEIYDYVYYPDRHITESFSVYNFRGTSDPFLMLPGTVMELQSHLDFLYMHLLDRDRLRTRLTQRLKRMLSAGIKANEDQNTSSSVGNLSPLDLAAISLSENTPVRRLKRLFENELIAPWRDPLPSRSELATRFDAALDVLVSIRSRRTSRVAQTIDAENLATVGFLNSIGGTAGSQTVHISGATSMQWAARLLLHHESSEFGTDTIPLVVSPYAWALRVYLDKPGVPDLPPSVFSERKIIELESLSKEWRRSIKPTFPR